MVASIAFDSIGDSVYFNCQRRIIAIYQEELGWIKAEINEGISLFKEAEMMIENEIVKENPEDVMTTE